MREVSKYHEVSLRCLTCGIYLFSAWQPISLAPYISLPPFPALFPEKVTELEGLSKDSVQSDDCISE